MKRILKRFLFPTIITVLVIAILCFLLLPGGMYDDGVSYSTYQIMFGCSYKNIGNVEFLYTNPLAVIVMIIYIAAAIVAWFNFKYDKFVVAGLFFLAAIFTMMLPMSVNKSEVAKYLLDAIEASGDKMMTILAGPYIVSAICLVAGGFAIFKDKFNSLFKITK